MKISDDLKMMSETITTWESESRYGGNFSVTKSEIERGIELYDQLTQSIEKFSFCNMEKTDR